MIPRLVAATSVLTALAAVAAAQTPPVLPDELPDDHDSAAETYSAFWERALRPNATAYDEKTKRAEVELANLTNDPKKWESAEVLLREAIALDPAAPYAWWLLGRLHEQRGDWAECASARSKVFDIDPQYVPPHSASWALSIALGECLALSGEYERAIEQYRRVLASGDARGSHAHVYLGQAYMAQGRVTDAIEAYRTARSDKNVNSDARRRNFATFALAVAYDRDEQLGLATEVMADALMRDRQMASLTTTFRFVGPAEEVYYQALAQASQARWRRAYAIEAFRRYIAEAGQDGWLARAQAHLDHLTSIDMTVDDVRVRGTAVIDHDKSRKAVVRAAADLEACMAATPTLLFRISITKIAKGTGRERKAPRASPRAIAPPQGGVHVRQIRYSKNATEPVFEAQACVERVARRIPLPKVTGSLNSYATVEFYLIAR